MSKEKKCGSKEVEYYLAWTNSRAYLKFPKEVDISMVRQRWFGDMLCPRRPVSTASKQI